MDPSRIFVQIEAGIISRDNFLSFRCAVMTTCLINRFPSPELYEIEQGEKLKRYVILTMISNILWHAQLLFITFCHDAQSPRCGNTCKQQAVSHPSGVSPNNLIPLDSQLLSRLVRRRRRRNRPKLSHWKISCCTA
jgi:hypothetical protein